MKKTILFLFVVMALGFILAEEPICVDFEAPSNPQNLWIGFENDGVMIKWDAATDTPDCSGIAFYEIYDEEQRVGETKDTSYFISGASNLKYIVYAVDKAGHKSQALFTEVEEPEPPKPSSSRGSLNSGSSGITDLEVIVNDSEGDYSPRNFEPLGSNGENERLPSGENQEKSEEESFGGGITGAFVGLVDSNNGKGLVFGTLVVLIAVVIFGFKKRKKVIE